MASIAIAPATGAVSVVPRWQIGNSLAGFHHMAQDLSLGGGPQQFYSIKGTAIPVGGDTTAFTRYISASGAATSLTDIGSKLRPNSYSALTSADPDLGFGSVQLYFIHHKTDGDYISHIVPGSGTASAVTDLKPMSRAGGPATGGDSGYFGLTFAAADLAYGANLFYYLRTDPVTGLTKFGSLVPALAGGSTDRFDLARGGHQALAFTGTDVGFGINRMYYVRLDPITGFSILGTLHPGTGRTSDIANLGSVFSTLTFVPGDTGFGTNQFYTTGPINPSGQSVSFAAIEDRAISAGAFTVTPSASSGLPITLSVVPGSIGAASISSPSVGVFTVTPTAPGLITLQATQVGQLAPTPFAFNMLRQSFTATGTATLVITSQPTSQTAATGGTATFSVSAAGTSVVSYQWRKAGVNITGNPSATSSSLSLASVLAADAANYDVVVTNASGSIISTPVTLTVTTAAPIITNTPLSAAGTVGAPFSFGIAASGSPASFTASPLPAGLVFNTTTGLITGSPSTIGTTSVLLGATNSFGTGNATLTITVAAASTAPVITNNPLTAAGTIGAPFNYAITATGLPTNYTASPLPAGLTLSPTTGAITGVPTSVGTTVTMLGATNSTGTGTATLIISIADVGVAPTVTNTALAAPGTVGSAFSYVITASGSPTSFSQTGLPQGLTLNPSTGAITGIPLVEGTSLVTVRASNAFGTGMSTLTITVLPATVAPVITSPTTAPGTVGAPFITYLIAATGTPTSYSASGLPPGLTVNPLTGAINGTPTTSGTYNVVLTAANAAGTSTANLTITVAAATVPPVITSPAVAQGMVGTPFVTYLITATGLPTSYAASGLPLGLGLNPLTGAINGTPTTAGSFVVVLTATNSAGVSTSNLTITIAAAPVAPFITSPLAAEGNVGQPFPTYLISATGLPTSFSAMGLPPGLSIDPLTGAITGTATAPGTYLVTLGAANANGTTTANLTIVIARAPSRIVNFSARALSGPGSQTLILGFVVDGEGKSLLIRGIGPSLAQFGITNTLADPMLTLYGATGLIASNDDWSNTAAGQPTAQQIAAAAARVGAFALATGSKDSALLLPFASGSHTTSMVRPNSTTGVALTEIYDTAPVSIARLINVSARMNVTAGEGALIAGFVIAGDTPKTVVIRAIGPTLASFGVNGVLADPRVALYSGSQVIGANDNWENGSLSPVDVSSTFARIGAFALPAGSKDAALIATLQPGAYTVVVMGSGVPTGVALVEIYDTQ